MPCFHPLAMVPLNGGSRVLGSLDKLEGKWYNDPVRGIKVVDPVTGELVSAVTVPCGKCMGCRIDYSQDWTSRILCELETSKNCWFLTLTLSDDTISSSSRFKELQDYKYPLSKFSLLPDEASRFLHRVQDYFREKFGFSPSYYLSGEYGDEFGRPHYHACVFNLPLDDLTFWEKSKTGYPLYRSALLEDLWNNKGLIVIGELNALTAGYTARYVMKKRKGYDSLSYEMEGLIPEFCRMSRRPGIGQKYFELNWQDIYITDKLYLPDRRPSTPPRYFDRLLEKKDPRLLSEVKSKRCFSAEILERSSSEVREYTEREYFTIQERNFSKRIEALKRSVF